MAPRIPRRDIEALVLAGQMAHRTHTADTGIPAVFREFGPLRWITVPLAGVAVAAFVWAVGIVVGGMQ